MRLADYDVSRPFDAVVVASTRITPEGTDEVRELVLDVDRYYLDIGAGQSIGVLAPVDPASGAPHHLRLYTVADVPERTYDGNARLRIAVRRWIERDPDTGVLRRGIASNFLCDLVPGQKFRVTGPYGQPFPVPRDRLATLVLIGAGTGIAPFRAFLKHLHLKEPEYAGRVVLFHGGRTGLDLLYRNDVNGDLDLYIDRGTFEAIEVLSNRPDVSAEPAWTEAIGERARELGRWLEDRRTHVYVAGHERIRDRLDEAFAASFGGGAAWARRKAGLVAEGRWIELLY